MSGPEPRVAVTADSPGSLFDVSGKSVLLIGATGAFGVVAAQALAAAGAKLTLAAGTADNVERLGGELRASGSPVEVVVGRPDSDVAAERLVESAVQAYGGLDALIVASGTNHVAPIVQQPVDDFDAVIAANLRGPWLACRAAGKEMLGGGTRGKVVLLSSTRGRLGHAAGYSAYCASKGGLDLLTRSLACEWGAAGITVNAIAPTVFRSKLTDWMYAQDGEGVAVREAMLSRIPLGRLGEPDDLVGALLFFLSRASDFCTGQVLYVDGGYTAG